MKLYTGPISMFGAKAQIALLEKGIKPDTVMVTFDLKSRYDPKHPEVLRINPKGQVPVLVDGDLELYDSTQIFEYLEDAVPAPPLWPPDPRDRVKARRLEHQADEVFYAEIIRLLNGSGDRDAAVARAAVFLAQAEATLGGKPYLAGAYSYADIALFMAVFFGEVMGVLVEDRHRALQAWRDRVGERATVRSIVGPMIDYMRENGIRLPPWATAYATESKPEPTR